MADRPGIRVLIAALNTYSAPYNDAKLEAVARHSGPLLAVTGSVPTLWGPPSGNREGAGYRVVALPVGLGFSNATTRLKGFGAIAERFQPGLIHIECEPWQAVAVDGVRTARRLGVPCGVQFAENGPMLRGPGGAVRKAVARRVLARCSYAIGWSSGSTGVARELAPRLTHATIPGTGVAPSSPAAERDWFSPTVVPRVAFVGRFAPEKGVEDFCAVCDLVSARLPIAIAVAGAGPQEETIRTWARGKPWVTVHGLLGRDEVAGLLAAADVLVVPSRTTSYVVEQFGKAPVEAMSLGVPVFAYDCGALAEVVGAGGVIVGEGRQQDMADALVAHFGAKQDTRAELAAAARAQAGRFSEERLAGELLAVWDGVLGRAS